MNGPYTAMRQGIPWFDPEQSLSVVLQLVQIAYSEHQADPRRNVAVCVLTAQDIAVQMLVMN